MLYLAACHNVDFVFENPEEAYKINVNALLNFFDAVDNIERLVFASTDCVYGEDGSKPLTERSDLNSVNEYGKQKIKAENSVINHGILL